MKKKFIRVNRKRFLAKMGREVRRHRLASGMSQREVAEIANIAPSYLSSIERGKSDVRLDKLARVVYSMGITMTTLVRGMGE